MSNNNHISELISYWLKKIDPKDRSTVEKLWQEAQKTDDTEQVTITKEEKAKALAHIKGELNLTATQDDKDEESIQFSPDSAPVTFLNWRWVAAAAIILIAAGISYLFIPVRVTAPYGEQKVVQLPDHSQVTLNSGSTLSYNRLFGITNRHTRLEGEAFFEVESGNDAFVVETFNAAVQVIGTKFNLRAWPSELEPETMVTLTEGKLSFQSLSEPENPVILTPGEKSSLRKNEINPSQPDKASIENTMAWMGNRFMFENRPLYQIIPELERRFDITIEVKASRILTDSLTIYYSNNIEAEQIINEICLSQGVSYRAINNGYVIENR